MKAKTAAEKRWHEFVAKIPCVVCSRFGGGGGRITLHHVAKGSGVRSHFAVVPLCEEHHQGGAGLHCMGPRRFLMLYRPPDEDEYGLLVWLLEDVAALVS
ncbi:Recombination enhancement, RecA-dependent nuclease [uncultured Caudovirales phage]|uniref:Recombination enhancement, RecA-dependent nuclease n=1 Tax=uncultured Caudovirales phage TaxID=2100421 RepID=A0A6J5QGJ1_9CAUD|nr:Recombination enhancement, RecA-dependent nuclease [uncultured Caudovirales phage]